jgi:hypothetical protein
MRKKMKCVRCETLDRSQKSKSVYMVKNELGESIPLCAVCIIEIREEEDFLESLKEEEDAAGGERTDQ